MMQNKQNGMTLIEVIITMFIMAVGLLGLSGLQATSVKGGLDTAKRSQVTWLVTELVERMRANPDGLTDYDMTFNAAACGAAPSSCSDSAANASDDCSASEMAAFDVWEVFCGQPAPAVGVLSNSPDSLNLTSVSISCVDTNCNDANDNYIVSMSWTSAAVNSSQVLSDTDRAAQETQSITMTVRP